jgi:hypothetical protein
VSSTRYTLVLDVGREFAYIDFVAAKSLASTGGEFGQAAAGAPVDPLNKPASGQLSLALAGGFC